MLKHKHTVAILLELHSKRKQVLAVVFKKQLQHELVAKTCAIRVSVLQKVKWYRTIRTIIQNHKGFKKFNTRPQNWNPRTFEKYWLYNKLNTWSPNTDCEPFKGMLSAQRATIMGECSRCKQINIQMVKHKKSGINRLLSYTTRYSFLTVHVVTFWATSRLIFLSSIWWAWINISRKCDNLKFQLVKMNFLSQMKTNSRGHISFVGNVFPVNRYPIQLLSDTFNVRSLPKPLSANP